MTESRFDIPKGFPQFDVHHWADWVELCCVENLDGSVTRKDAERRVQLARSLQADKLEDARSSEEMVGDALEPDPEGGDILERDAISEKVAVWFEHLAARAEFFGNAYPFTVSEERERLDMSAHLSDPQRLYICLLMMANLHYFSEIEAVLTSDFEQVCREALRHFLPAAAEVHVFGKGKAASLRYSGKVWERLRTLAEDLRGEFVARPEDFPSTSTGDGGLDLVAWVPLADPAPGRFAMFGQCACTTDWRNKQYTSDPRNWCEGKMHLQCAPVNAVFTPFYPRKLDGKWHRPQDFGRYLHLDRLRLANILGPRAADLADLGSFVEAAKLAEAKAEPY